MNPVLWLLWHLFRGGYLIVRRHGVKILLAAPIMALAAYLLFFTPEKRMVRYRIGEADAKSEAAMNERMKPIRVLFSNARKGSKKFAGEAVSLRGKLALLRGTIDGTSHHAFLASAFAEHVFSQTEFRQAIEACCRSYLDDVDGIDGELLVQLRIDLADPARPAAPPPDLAKRPELVAEFRQLAARVASTTGKDVGVNVGREVVALVGGEIASQVAVQAAKSAAAEMGVQAGVLGTGAASAVATLGAGIVIGFIIDYILDEIFKLAGYDPERDIDAAVCASLTRMESALLRDADWTRHVGWETKGSLRLELEKLHDARARLRRDSVNLMLRERGGK